MRVWPRPELVTELQSPLPNVVLVAGLLMASLLALAVSLAQRARLRVKQAELANLELENEIAERQLIARIAISQCLNQSVRRYYRA